MDSSVSVSSRPLMTKEERDHVEEELPKERLPSLEDEMEGRLPGPINLIECDFCHVVSKATHIEESTEDGNFKLRLLEMEECGHQYVTGIIDETTRKMMDKGDDLLAKAQELFRAGDESGFLRFMDKYKAMGVNVKIRMRHLWKEYGTLLTDAHPIADLLDDATSRKS